MLVRDRRYIAQMRVFTDHTMLNFATLIGRPAATNGEPAYKRYLGRSPQWLLVSNSILSIAWFSRSPVKRFENQIALLRTPAQLTMRQNSVQYQWWIQQFKEGGSFTRVRDKRSVQKIENYHAHLCRSSASYT